MTARKRLRLKDDVVNDWSVLEADTMVYRYLEGEVMYGGKPVRVVWANSDAVGFNLPELLDAGHAAIQVRRGKVEAGPRKSKRADPRKDNQFVRA